MFSTRLSIVLGTLVCYASVSTLNGSIEATVRVSTSLTLELLFFSRLLSDCEEFIVMDLEGTGKMKCWSNGCSVTQF